MKLVRPLSEDYREVAEKWVGLDGAARMMEEGKSAALSQMMVANGAKTVSKAEMLVKASKDWSDYIIEMVRCRTVANEAKVRLEYVRMRFAEQQSDAATERAAARL